MTLEKGIFTISIDFELAWGYADMKITDELMARIKKEPEIVKRLLGLFDKYNIPATWAIVGRLLDKKEDGNSEIWLDKYGLIFLIQQSSAKHEIGSHSYAHIIYGDKNVDKKVIQADISQAALIHSGRELDFKSFIFPRNREGYHVLLKEQGIEVFRGETKFWYNSLLFPLDKIGRIIDYWDPRAKTVMPSRHSSGLLDVPDSLLLWHRKGYRRLVSAGAMERKIKFGIARAVKKQEIFHLWFHPFNFTYDTEKQFKIFEEALKYAVEKRERGELEIMTMGGIAAKLSV